MHLIADMLATADLLIDDLPTQVPDYFVIAELAGDVVGVVGLQLAGGCGVLRSLLVTPACRGEGLGKLLVRRLEGLAAEVGVEHLYLLTETAPKFFQATGYQLFDRVEVPQEVADMAQFASLCPASAICLYKDLPARIC